MASGAKVDEHKKAAVLAKYRHGVSPSLLAQEYGISTKSIHRWNKEGDTKMSEPEQTPQNNAPTSTEKPEAVPTSNEPAQKTEDVKAEQSTPVKKADCPNPSCKNNSFDGKVCKDCGYDDSLAVRPYGAGLL